MSRPTNNAQKLILDKIGTKSAQIKTSMEMLENLKKVTSNPRAINAVGSSQLMQMLQSIFDKFYKNKKPKNKEEEEEIKKLKEELEQQIEQIQQQIITNNKLIG